MRLPVRLPEYHPFQRWLVACLIGIVCMLVGVLADAPSDPFLVIRKLDHVFYDSLYRMRGVETQTSGPIVIVAVDDESIAAVDKARKFGWPWPREFYGHMVRYLDQAGAKAVVFDLLFDRSSVYNNASNDDEQFAEMVNAAKTQSVFATVVRGDGTPWDLAPPVKEKVQGAANVAREDFIRSYDPVVNGFSSLARRVMERLKISTPEWAGAPFLLHYYGPHAVGNSPVTFRYVRAGNLLAAALEPGGAKAVGISPEMFRDKIVFIATITAGTYDLKSSPLSAQYPGVEVHATALQNMISNDRVQLVGAGWRASVLLLGCLLTSCLTMLPTRVPVKFLGGLTGLLVVGGTCGVLFLKRDIHWLPPAGPLLAVLLSAFASLAYSYFTEVRQRQFVLRALTQYVSKDVADELTKDPRKLSLSGERRTMTVMFTDLANFTALSETLSVERLAHMLNFYLQEMSGVILQQNGTLDKYIGDSIMSFWNAPVNQSDHAKRACHAALEMRRREKIIAGELKELAGGVDIHSRIGLNSGPMIVGNMGSSHKFDYTVLGDAVNLASRLEAANKMYGTRVLLSETTAGYVNDAFILRKVDLLRVKGKKQPMAVYELMGEGMFDPQTGDLIRRYEKAFAHYQAREVEAALEELVSLAADFPEDGPTATLLGRVLLFREAPPSEHWDGVFTAKEK